MKYLPIEIAIDLIEYWILILTAQYICSAHLNLCPRNVFLGSILPILGAILSEYAVTGNVLPLLIVLGELTLTVLLFSRKRLSDLPRLLAAIAIFYTLMVPPELMLDTIMPRSLISISPDYTYTWYDMMLGSKP